MNRKHRSLFISLSLILLLLFSVMSAKAAEIKPFASYVFKKTSISLTTSGNATFYASVDTAVSSISISNCILQQKSGSKWVTAATLEVPESMSDTIAYYKSKDYHSSMSSGKTYRIKATFSAGGHTVTDYSGSITYK